jgi:1-phosphofructokinase family hexose kinase
MSAVKEPPRVITVSLNPAVDRTIEVPNFTIGAHQLGREVARTPGGKGVNISRVLAAMGVPSAAAGFLGAESRDVFAPLFADGTVGDHFVVLPGRTRENVTITDPAARTETHIRDADLAVTDDALGRLAETLESLCEAGCIAVFSGSLPPGASPADQVALAERCVAAGARVAVDTSGDALRAFAGRRLWLVKPNRSELEQLVGRALGGREEQIAAARQLTAHVEHVLLSCGAEGAYLFTAKLALHARADVEPSRVRNTVGCGDALLGAFVAGMARGGDLRECLAAAAACASASACRPTAATFDPEMMAQLRQKVELREVR